MANVVKAEIENLVEKEFKAAAEKFGELNNSTHESFAVLAEEVDEAQNEMKAVIFQMNYLWTTVKNNVIDITQYQKIAERSINLAIEAIQVAAMAKKGLLTAENIRDKEK